MSFIFCVAIKKWKILKTSHLIYFSIIDYSANVILPTSNEHQTSRYYHYEALKSTMVLGKIYALRCAHTPNNHLDKLS